MFLYQDLLNRYAVFNLHLHFYLGINRSNGGDLNHPKEMDSFARIQLKEHDQKNNIAVIVLLISSIAESVKLKIRSIS